MHRASSWPLLLGAAAFLAVIAAFATVLGTAWRSDRAAQSAARQAALKESLRSAILFSDFPRIQNLLDQGADINTQNGAVETALIQAVAKPNVEMVKMLLDRGADANAASSYGNHALYYAATGTGPEGQRRQIAQMLLDHGAAIDAGNGYGQSALETAIGSPRNDNIIQLLLTREDDVHRNNANGYCLLDHSAEFGGNPEATRWVLARMPEVPPAERVRLLRQAEGNALCEACYAGDLATVKQRLAEGANVNAYKNRGVTGNPVTLSATPEILQLLLSEGASPTIHDPEEEDFDTLSALEAAAAETRPAFRKGAALRLKMLLGHGVSARGIDGQMALMRAEENDNSDCLRVLLDHGANVNATTRNNAAPEGVDPDAKQTVLMRACYMPEEGGESHRPEAVRLLLAHGADVNRRDGAEHTALYYARQYARSARQYARHVAQDVRFKRQAAQDAEESDGIIRLLLKVGARE